MFLRPGEVVQHLRDKKYVLQGVKGADFGCGTGYFTVLLAQEVGHSGKVYAIDIDEEAIKEAQEFVNQFALRNVKFLHQDLEINSGLENNSLDFVFISQVLYQSDEPYKIIFEAKRVLKNKGYFIVLEPQKENPLFTGQRVHSFQDIVDLMEKESFKIIEIEEASNYYLVVGQKE
jgi:ubiquinone/menaquinone biosynthesis C-methylase UbiE